MFLLHIYPNSTFLNIKPGVPDEPFGTIATAWPLFARFPSEGIMDTQLPFWKLPFWPTAESGFPSKQGRHANE